MRRLGLLVFLFFLAACGGGEDAADTALPSTTRPDPSTTIAPATTSTAAPAATTAPTTTTAPAGLEMTLTSTVFDHEGLIPVLYSCDGSDISPPLALAGVLETAVSLALVMDDPDAPVGVWDHWVVYDIAIGAAISEEVADLGTPGQNSWGRTGYGGPCPPGGIHRYIFTVYALDSELGLESGATKEQVLAAISDHVLAEATLLGNYGR